MARIKVPQSEGNIVFFDGEQTVYKVTDGVIDVADDHATRVIAGVPGAELIPEPEPPAESDEPEILAEEK